MTQSYKIQLLEQFCRIRRYGFHVRDATGRLYCSKCFQRLNRKYNYRCSEMVRHNMVWLYNNDLPTYTRLRGRYYRNCGLCVEHLGGRAESALLPAIRIFVKNYYRG